MLRQATLFKLRESHKHKRVMEVGGRLVEKKCFSRKRSGGKKGERAKGLKFIIYM